MNAVLGASAARARDQEEFWDLVAADPELVRAQFDEIIAACRPQPVDRSAPGPLPRGSGPLPGPRRPRAGGPGAGVRIRARGPPGTVAEHVHAGGRPGGRPPVPHVDGQVTFHDPTTVLPAHTRA